MKMRKSFLKELPTPELQNNAEKGQNTHIPATSYNSNTKTHDDDVISQLIGDSGRWQFKMCFLLSLFNIPCTWHMIVQTFQTVPEDHWCARPSHLMTVDSSFWKAVSQPDNSSCSTYTYDWSGITAADFQSGNVTKLLSNITKSSKCHKWEWSGPRTLQSEWDLICDREHLNSVAEMVFLGGVALGGLISGIISDHYGRKRTLFASVLIQTIVGSAIAFAPSLEIYLILRCILGFFSVSVVFSGFVLSVELVGGYWRTVAGIAYMLPVPISSIILSGLAWFIRDWNDLQLAVSLPSVLYLLIFLIIPESPRWLLAMGRKSNVLDILCDAAIYNNRKLPENIDKLLQSESERSTDDADKAEILDLFRSKEIRKNTFFLLIIWFVVYLIYYGLVLNMGNIGGDLYINTVLSGVVEVPALLISIIVLLTMSCRLTFFVTLLASGIACFLTIFVPSSFKNDTDLQWIKTTLVMFGKFSISSCNVLMPIYTAELYPTTIRNLGIGLNNVPAGVALMLLPYLWDPTMFKNIQPIMVLGVAGFIGSLCLLFLPETENYKCDETDPAGPDAVRPKQEETFTLDASIDNSLVNSRIQSHHI